MTHHFHDWFITESFLFFLVFFSPNFVSFQFVLKHYRQLCQVLQLVLRCIYITVSYGALLCVGVRTCARVSLIYRSRVMS